MKSLGGLEMKQLDVKNYQVHDEVHLRRVLMMRMFCDSEIYTLEPVSRNGERIVSWPEIQESREQCFEKIVSLLELEDMKKMESLLLITENLYLFHKQMGNDLSLYENILSQDSIEHMGEMITEEQAISLLKQYLTIACSNYEWSEDSRAIYESMKESEEYQSFLEQMKEFQNKFQYTYRGKIYTKLT